MSDQYFPIKTKTACALKWNWSTLRLYSGTTSSCHRASISDIPNNFDEFHNTPPKLAARKLMLENQWPTGGCEYCHQIETAGGFSDRMLHLNIPNMHPAELELNTDAIEVTPTVLEIYFNNVCNMSCIYCYDGFSSQIQQENIKFGRFDKQGVVIDNRAVAVNDLDTLTDRLWQWMKKNSVKLKRFHLLGGEPFYQSEFDRCLEFFEQHPCPALEFNIVSNLMVPTQRFETYITKIKNLIDSQHLKRFDLTVSIDCFGPEQEYVRYGLDLEIWRKNFEYVVEQPWITLNINQTLTGLTIKTVPELLQYVNQFRTNREIGHFFSTVVMSHASLHPEIFGAGFFDADFEKILNNMPDTTWQQKEARKYMQGIQLQLTTQTRDQEKINQLVVLLDEIDRRRNLNWKNTFPWLVKELENVV